MYSKLGNSLHKVSYVEYKCVCIIVYIFNKCLMHSNTWLMDSYIVRNDVGCPFLDLITLGLDSAMINKGRHCWDANWRQEAGNKCFLYLNFFMPEQNC